MAQHNQHRYQHADLKTPVRSRYFYGKLLDVFHFELEQEYFNSKRWLLNRLVTGYGVVCGLDVKLTSDYQNVFVLPGLAIDRCGREIIVAEPSQPVKLPPMPPYQADSSKPESQTQYQGRTGHRHYCDDEYAHVVLCYHECESDPVPALAADCETTTLCAAGSIREQYKVEVRPGYVQAPVSDFPDVITGQRINYSAIVEYVTQACDALPDDCCIPLANVRLRDSGRGWEPEIDINCRPIVYSNRLLYDLLVSLVK